MMMMILNFQRDLVFWITHTELQVPLISRVQEFHGYIYTGCPRRNVPDFGRVFLRSNYTDIIQNTSIQS